MASPASRRRTLSKRRLGTAELAGRLGLSPVRVRELARGGRITFATKLPSGRYAFSESSRVIRALRDVPLPEEDDAPIEHKVREIRYWLERGH